MYQPKDVYAESIHTSGWSLKCFATACPRSSLNAWQAESLWWLCLWWCNDKSSGGPFCEDEELPDGGWLDHLKNGRNIWEMATQSGISGQLCLWSFWSALNVANQCAANKHTLCLLATILSSSTLSQCRLGVFNTTPICTPRRLTLLVCRDSMFLPSSTDLTRPDLATFWAKESQWACVAALALIWTFTKNQILTCQWTMLHGSILWVMASLKAGHSGRLCTYVL